MVLRINTMWLYVGEDENMDTVDRWPKSATVPSSNRTACISKHAKCNLLLELPRFCRPERIHPVKGLDLPFGYPLLT